jgi:hypothetical protein
MMPRKGAGPALRHFSSRQLTNESDLRGPQAKNRPFTIPVGKVGLRGARSDATKGTCHRRYREKQKRNEENDLGHFDRGAGYATEPEQGRDQRDDQQSNDPVKHGTDLQQLRTSTETQTKCDRYVKRCRR